MGQDYGIGKLTSGVVSTDQASSPQAAQAGYLTALNPQGYLDGSLMEPNRFQTKFLSITETTPATPMTDLAFNNLVIGNTYQIIGRLLYLIVDESILFSTEITHDGVTIWDGKYTSNFDGSPTQTNQTLHIPVNTGLFVATTTTTICFIQQNSDDPNSGVLGGPASKQGTWLQIIEHKQSGVITSDFT